MPPAAGGGAPRRREGRPVEGLGRALVLAGLVLHLLPGIPGLGRLPGDLRIEREGFRLYVPITSCLLLSGLLSGLLWLLGRLR